MQEKLFRKNLDHLLKITMLSLFGEIDEDITFDFVPLFEMTGKELALIRKSDGERDVAFITAGVVSNTEVRAKVASDPDSGFDNLDVDDPKGKLLVPSEAALGKKIGASTSAEEGATEGAEMAGNDEQVQALMTDAMAQDSFWGNQHTGSLGTQSDHPAHVASMASSVARRATSVANKAVTQAAHNRAIFAHQRALEAHQSALGSASKDARHIHEAYIEAHQAAIESHRQKAGEA